jgi:pimeloyl-ACP methyl ester carboxylesterase
METDMTTTRRLLGTLAAFIITTSAEAQSAPTPTPAVNIVLVHGALIDGSSWRGVYDVLTRDGYHVSIVQQPLTGLDEDVAATKRVLDQQDGPVILVGHSYGGSIITVAGSDPKVLEARTVTPRPFFPSFFLGKTVAHATGCPSARAGVASARRLRTRVPSGIRWDALRARGAASPRDQGNDR